MKTVSPNNNKPPAAPKGKWWWPILGIQSDPPARHPLWKIRETGVQLWKADEAHAIAAWGVTFVDAGGQTQTGFFG